MNFGDKFCGRSRSLTLNHYDNDESQNIALIKDNKHEFQMPQLIIHMFRFLGLCFHLSFNYLLWDEIGKVSLFENFAVQDFHANFCFLFYGSGGVKW